MDTTKMNLDAAMKRIMVHGPDRVVISRDGEAISSRRARERLYIVPSIIFIRSDGWSLGAPSHFEGVAYGLWKNEWAGFVRNTSTTYEHMSSYRAQSNPDE